MVKCTPEIQTFPSRQKHSSVNSRIDVVLLHYAKSPLDTKATANTRECLESLAASDFYNSRLILVDSGSRDHMVGEMKKSLGINNPYPFPIVTISLKDNLGYTGATNLGASWSVENGSKYVFLVNNDVTVDRSCLTKLVSFADTHSRVATVGPKVFDNQSGIKTDTLQYIGGRFIGGNFGGWTKDRGQFEHPKEVDFVSGAACLVRSTVIKELGLYDPRYFIWFEDIDFGIKVKENGYQAYYVPGQVWHKGATSLTNRYGPEYAYYSARNIIYTIRKHPNQWGLQLIPRFLFVEAKTMFGALFIHKNSSSVRALIDGVRDGLQLQLEK